VLGARFDDIRDALLTDRFGVADPFMTLADFDDYARAQDLAGTVYTNRSKFNSMSLVNIAQAGVFSADRAIKEYCNKIWNINKY